MVNYKYSSDFFEYIREGSIASAKEIVPVILSLFHVSSVLDVGCGKGAWLKVWRENNIEIVGIDKDNDTGNLLIPHDKFMSIDISDKFNLGSKFDLVECLEVAEHLPKQSSECLVESLANHGDMILFSAAPPGQGGEYHINEQPYDFWQKIFDKYEFDMYDIIRPAIISKPNVRPYYKYNIFLFIRRGSDMGNLRLNRIENSLFIQRPSDISPVTFKIRKYLIRLLPVTVVTQLSIFNRTVRVMGSFYAHYFIRK